MSALSDWFSAYPGLTLAGQLIGIVLLALAAHQATRFVIHRTLPKLAAKSATQLDDSLIRRGVFQRLGYLIPLLVLYAAVPLTGGLAPLLDRLLSAVAAAIVIAAVGAFVSAMDDLARHTDFARRIGLSSYLQVARLGVYLLGGMVVIGLILGRSPLALLSGVGALTAVLLLVFKDTILSFVASIRIASGDLIQVGDWIEMPDFGADGDVIELSLYAVKVQNWDKTISTIPSYKFLDHSFKNWRGMSESGGRRIKRALYIDMNSIRFCDGELLDRFAGIALISDYVRSRRAEVDAHNRSKQVDMAHMINGRQLTNLGTFRVYIEAYLRDNPLIRDDMTFLIRQLSPGPNGLPVEIYVFTGDTRWEQYEAIQADIFDHLLAVAPQFDLRVFQDPTGADWREGKVPVGE